MPRLLALVLLRGQAAEFFLFAEIQELPLPRREEFLRGMSLGVSAEAGLSDLRH
jgi:hypothetical protein